MDLAQPCVLAAPGMVHRSRALGEGVQRELFSRYLLLLKRLVPDWQRIKVVLDPLPQMIGRLTFAFTFGAQLELAHRLNIQLEKIWLFLVEQADLHRPFLIGLVPRFEVQRLFRDVVNPEAAIVDILLDLVRVRIAAPVLIAIFTTET